jgi:glycine/D-amino acid oxidase-like deaminating enzyme
VKETTLWLEGVRFPELDAAQPLPEQVDVAVIGGGYTGLTAALALAKRRASVAVLEAQSLGWGASSRNGGQVLTGLKLDSATLIKKYGLERARQMFAASLAAIDCVEQIVREHNIDCNFERSGHLLLAAKPKHFQALVTEAALLKREFGHDSYLIAPSEQSREIGSKAYHGALLDPVSAGVNPARYVAGLAWAAQRAGAQLFPHTPAQRISRSRKGFVINTPRGHLRAKEVVIATSGYTGAATPVFRRRVIPIGSYIIATEPLPADLARELSPHRRMMFDTKHFLYYFRLTPDRRMLFGGRARFFPESPSTVRESAEILRKGMLSVYPQLHDTRIEYAWGGTLDFAFDMMPHAGKLRGMHYALGYAGHGVAMASYLGTQIGKHLAGEPADNPFAGMRFPTAPLGAYNGHPWFLPFVGLWYRFLDIIH